MRSPESQRTPSCSPIDDAPHSRVNVQGTSRFRGANGASSKHRWNRRERAPVMFLWTVSLERKAIRTKKGIASSRLVPRRGSRRAIPANRVHPSQHGPIINVRVILADSNPRGGIREGGQVVAESPLKFHDQLAPESRKKKLNPSIPGSRRRAASPSS